MRCLQVLRITFGSSYNKIIINHEQEYTACQDYYWIKYFVYITLGLLGDGSARTERKNPSALW